MENKLNKKHYSPPQVDLTGMQHFTAITQNDAPKIVTLQL